MKRRILLLSSLSWLPLVVLPAADSPAKNQQPASKPSPFPKARRAHPKIDSTAVSDPPAIDVDISPDTGKASYFAGEEMVAAHPNYPLGARVKVTNLANGKSVEVKIVGRFSASSGRIINVSETAARQLDFLKAGTAEVRVEAAH
jgi:rare lipoprotein A